MSALNEQVGGNNYKVTGIQPIEFCMSNGLNFCQSNVVKYIFRYKTKNGREDLLKARHYIDILLELEYGYTHNGSNGDGEGERDAAARDKLHWSACLGQEDGQTVLVPSFSELRPASRLPHKTIIED